ncbi:hypothetical protein OCAR_7037 [Afipia carboxidovorans OM5]|nr:hypothetical protein OCAR_7037 [Afipia carboxidovorans OM5]
MLFHQNLPCSVPAIHRLNAAALHPPSDLFPRLLTKISPHSILMPC